ncbi:MAG: hypothetical protein M0Z55_10615 [Peptococcaceae bacterium]|nr:hypothetical protein [Peptococcaceae bacterium]
MQLNQETINDVKDGESLRKALLEAEVVGKKCRLYASIAQDGGVRSLFENTAHEMDTAIEKMKKITPRYM